MILTYPLNELSDHESQDVSQVEMELPARGGWWFLTALAALDAAGGLVEATQMLLKVVTHVSVVISTHQTNVAGALLHHRSPILSFWVL